MVTKTDTFVIIPAYNESQVIQATLLPLLQAGYSVVVVDDGSSDATWNILLGLPVYALRHPINLGQGAALQTGVTFSLQQGARYIVHFDADGQHRVEDIESLLEPLRTGAADIVLGSRFLHPEDARLVPKSKRLLLKGAVILNGLFTGLWLSDAHNGLRAMTQATARKIEIRENGFAHATEIHFQIRSLNLRCIERPASITYTAYSRAKGQSLWNAFDILLDLVYRKLFQ